MDAASGSGRFPRGRLRVDRSRQITIGFSLALSAGAVVAAAIHPVDSALTSAVILPAAAMLPLMALTRLQIMIELSSGRTSHAFVPEFVLSPTLFLVLLVALWLFVPLTAFHTLWVQALAVATGAIVQVWLFRSAQIERPPEKPATFRTREWLITAAPLLALDIFTSYFAEINVLLLGMMAAAGEVAVFHVAFRMAMLIGIGIHAIESAMLVIAAGPLLLDLFGPDFRAGQFALVVLRLAQLQREEIIRVYDENNHSSTIA